MRILVLGGYGLFGGRIARTLARDPGTTVVVAGRDRARAERFVAGIENPSASLETAALDTADAAFEVALAALRPDLVIDTAGPFQGRGHRVAEAALAIGAHCIDLADAREHVRGIDALDAQARAAGRRIVSGASSVPGLHAAVLAAHAGRFATLQEVETAICPGNRTPRGWATTLAILGYVGRPFPLWRDGAWRTAYGWQSLRRVRVPGVGARWAARCDVPDLELLPARFPQLRTLEFRAGLELRRMHFGLWLASWAVRLRLLRSMARFARPLFSLSEAWQGLGSDTGFMRIEMRGTGHHGERKSLAWSLVARDGHGPQIPATAAVVLARKLARGELAGGGATPCLDLFSLDEFLVALEGFSMQVVVEDGAPR